MINVFESMVIEYKEMENEKKLPKEIEEIINNCLLFSVIWSIGCGLDEFTRPKFDTFLQEMIFGDDIITKYKLDLAVTTQD
jgi:hypothetical protein